MSNGYYDDYGSFTYHSPAQPQYTAWDYQQPQVVYGSSTFGTPPNYSNMERDPSNSSGSSYNSNDSSPRSYDAPATLPVAYYNPNIEFVDGGTVNSSKQNGSSPKANSNSDKHDWYCIHPGCGHVSKRQFDLSRHIQNKHNIGNELHDCPGRNCHRVGPQGFKRRDHLREHLRNVHMQKIPKASSRKKPDSD